MINIFKARLSCGHTRIFTESELQKSAVGKQLDVKNNFTPRDTFLCDDCTGADKNKGFCDQSIYHPIEDLRKLSPLEVARFMDKIKK